MGIKTIWVSSSPKSFPLKNLPTTWGLRRMDFRLLSRMILPLKNLPTTWGLRLKVAGISTVGNSLKNLPTTWGLRHYLQIL